LAANISATTLAAQVGLSLTLWRNPVYRFLNIVDDVTRECLAAIPDTSISGRRVTRELAVCLRYDF
jgi:hypothetical protein